MARNYRPSAPFNVPMKILVPSGVTVQGTLKKIFPDPDNVSDETGLFFGSFRTFGGTENVQNGVYTLINTAVIDTWYRPDIKADCRIYVCETGQTYEIVSDPEDIDMRHQYLQFKVRKVGGKP
jgi:SPP1 family predicted phage head-tail adaptor